MLPESSSVNMMFGLTGLSPESEPPPAWLDRPLRLHASGCNTERNG